MPRSAPKPCVQCGVLVDGGLNRCEAHRVRPGSFADLRRGSRHERGYGSAWERLRERILARDGGLCQPSLRHGLVVPATQVDHILPKALGGTDSDGNLQAISKAVHAAKSAAEGRGQRWDEAAYFARLQQAAPLPAGVGGGGAEMSAAPATRTGRFPEFLRAQVSGEGGVARGGEVQASAPAVEGAA